MRKLSLTASFSAFALIVFSTPFSDRLLAQIANDGSCIGKIGGTSIVQPVDIALSVGRKIYHPIGIINGERTDIVSVTCENEDNKLKTFNASFVLPDNWDLQQVQFIFYLDGKVVKTLNVYKGKVASISVTNIDKYSSFAYDVKHVEGCCWARPYVLKWQLLTTNR